MMAPLISPESFEPIRRECSESRRVLDVLVPEIGLKRARIVAVVGELVAGDPLRSCPSEIALTVANSFEE
jgi:hypothetical protein